MHLKQVNSVILSPCKGIKRVNKAPGNITGKKTALLRVKVVKHYSKEMETPSQEVFRNRKDSNLSGRI